MPQNIYRLLQNTMLFFLAGTFFGQFSHNIEAEMGTIRAEGWNNDDLRLFAHNFYLIKKLAIIEIAEAFSQSISWGGLDRVLCIRKSEWGRQIIGK